MYDFSCNCTLLAASVRPEMAELPGALELDIFYSLFIFIILNIFMNKI
jgi:hypothetical protein